LSYTRELNELRRIRYSILLALRSAHMGANAVAVRANQIAFGKL